MQAREGIKPAQYHITWSDDTDRQLVLWPQIVHFFHLSWLRVAVCPYNPGPAVCLNKQLRHPHCVSPKPDAHREPRRITSQMYCLLCVSLVHANEADSPLFLADCSAFSFCFLKVKRKQFPAAHPLSLSVMLSNQTKLQFCKQTQINSQSYA